jgi:FkbM family methyltransferase
MGQGPLQARRRKPGSGFMPLRRGRLRGAQRRLTRPARRAPLPVLRGNGRGLRVCFGDSALIRVLSSVERDVEDAFLGLLRPGDVVYDLGANIGWYSMLAARIVGSSGRVVAFEPALLNAATIQRNVLGNDMTNVTVIPAAATDQDGWMAFLDRGNLQSRLDKDDCEAQRERRAKRRKETTVKGRSLVPITKLDSWIAQTDQPAPSVVKIDVEGAEVGVLRGMSQILRLHEPTLIIELHSTRSEVADFLDGAGYEHALIETDVPTREAPWTAHVLARPRAASREL